MNYFRRIRGLVASRLKRIQLFLIIWLIRHLPYDWHNIAFWVKHNRFSWLAWKFRLLQFLTDHHRLNSEELRWFSLRLARLAHPEKQLIPKRFLPPKTFEVSLDDLLDRKNVKIPPPRDPPVAPGKFKDHVSSGDIVEIDTIHPVNTNMIKIAVQINGKLIDTMDLVSSVSKLHVIEFSRELALKRVPNLKIEKIVIVPGKLANVLAKEYVPAPVSEHGNPPGSSKTGSRKRRARTGKGKRKRK